MSVTSPFGRKRASIARRVGGLDYLLKRGNTTCRLAEKLAGSEPAPDAIRRRIASAIGF
jgi:hypothetical protein